MKIHSLKISGFKSIDEIELNDIPSFMVLAGANGSGKSNFVDALAFLGEVIRTNLNHAVEQFHGEDFICNRDFSKHIGDISFSLVIKENKHSYSYIITFSLGISNPFISYEKFIYLDEKGIEKEIEKPFIDIDLISILENIEEDILLINNQIKTKERELNSFKINDEPNKVTYLELKSELLNLINKKLEKELIFSKTQAKLQEQISSLNDVSILKNIPEAKPLVDFLTNIEVFRIDPVQAKTPSLQGSTSKLLPNGSNIADILEKHQSDPEFREELMEWLEMIVPNLSFVQAEKRQIDTSSVLRFQEGEHTFPAGLISDGTIYTLCILTAILSRSPQHGITIIEEPERGIHPQAIGELIALMREKAQDKHNIILTTHSEAVVRNLELDELYLVHKENGKTIINDVKNSGVDKRQIPLDEAWLTNSFNGGLPW